MTALILDCDGTLADNERYGHLPAFNQAFREFGLPVEWSEEEYGRLLRIAGGRERMATLLTPEFVKAAGLPPDRKAQLAKVARWHRRKTEIYVEMVVEGRIPPRPGVRRLIAEALEAKWTLAVASTAAEPSVRAVLDRAAGPDLAAQFSLVLTGDSVPNKKPAPDVYLIALQRLGVDPAEALVIEDSRSGLLAATAAGVRCVVVVSSFTQAEDFSEAILAVTSLGAPGGEQTHVIANRGRARPGDYITLRDLADCLAS
ncbi:MAG: HAD-IA family hydrolase [Candidatus Limnocylindrales bacterium]